MYRIILLLAVFVLLHACGGGGFTSAIDKPDLNGSVKDLGGNIYAIRAADKITLLYTEESVR
jgi:hypothetical protein